MNERAEEILLGSILKDNTILDEIILSPNNFLDMTNKNIYKAMLEVKKKGFPIDGASLKDQLGETGFLFVGGNDRLEAYKNAVASVHAFKSYEQMIINQWKINSARNLMRNVLDAELSAEHLQSLIKDLNKIDEEGSGYEEFNLKNELTELFDEIVTETPLKRSGIPSGYLKIDDMTDGFQPTDLVVIGARPSMGKTAFILNMAINAAAKGGAIPVIFSLEMSKKKLLKRMQSCIAEVNGMKLKNVYHYTNDEEKERLKKSLKIIEGISPTIYDKAGQKVSEMRAKVRKIKHDNPGKDVIVFIDYLTKIKPSKDFGGNTHAEVTEISQDLKDMAKDFNIPVVCLAQLSRRVEQRDDKRPMKSDLRESGSIEQDADIIGLLYRDEYYNPDTELKNILEVDISKNRDGEVGKVDLLYKMQINKIENLYHYHKK